MTSLIYSVNPQSPHLETDLEIAAQLKQDGHRVVLMRCTGQLESSLANPAHNPIICAACRSKYSYALELTGLEDIEQITFPEIETPANVIPDVFENSDALRAFTIDGLDAGNAVMSTLVGKLDRDHKFDTKKYRKEVYRELLAWRRIYEGFRVVLDRLKPDEVYFFNGRFSSYHPVRVLCADRGITWYTHERGGVLGKFIVRKNALPHNIRYATEELNHLWRDGGPEKEQIGSKFFTDRRNKVIQSWVSFVGDQKQGLLPAGFDGQYRNVVIFNSTMEEYEGMPDWANHIYKDDNEGIRRLLESFAGEPGYRFYLRVHPNLKLLNNSQVREIYQMGIDFPHLHIIKPEELVDSYFLMDHADKVVVFGSTVGAEATFWGKTSILLGKATYMDIDACYEAGTHQKAVELIKRPDLAPKPKLNAIKYGYWELMKGQPYKLFEQVDLFSMARNGKRVQSSRFLSFLAKFARLFAIRNKRDVDDMKKKLKELLRY